MEFAELIKLVGVVIVILGFALKLDSILIIFLALISTGLVGGLGIDGLLESIGTNFTANRSMAIFIMIFLVTGVLERNGLREAAAALMHKVKSATAGRLVCAYGILRGFFAAFNVGFGGVAGFVRPVLMPMTEGAIENTGNKPNEEHMEEIKEWPPVWRMSPGSSSRYCSSAEPAACSYRQRSSPLATKWILCPLRLLRSRSPSSPLW